MITNNALKEYLIITDIGKKNDPFVIQIYRTTPVIYEAEPEFNKPERVIYNLDLIYIKQVLDMDYVKFGDLMCEIVNSSTLVNNNTFIMDCTGVGEAVKDILLSKNLTPIGINFVGGEGFKIIYNESDFKMIGATNMANFQSIKQINVSKQDLTTAGQLIAQQNRLRIAPNVKHIEDFKKQMLNFKGKVNEATGNVKYENAKSSIHDDMVVCFLMVSWWVLKYSMVLPNVIESSSESSQDISYNVYDCLN